MPGEEEEEKKKVLLALGRTNRGCTFQTELASQVGSLLRQLRQVPLDARVVLVDRKQQRTPPILPDVARAFVLTGSENVRRNLEVGVPFLTLQVPTADDYARGPLLLPCVPSHCLRTLIRYVEPGGAGDGGGR